jgi:hypothetical protein
MPNVSCVTVGANRGIGLETARSNPIASSAIFFIPVAGAGG